MGGNPAVEAPNHIELFPRLDELKKKISDEKLEAASTNELWDH